MDKNEQQKVTYFAKADSRGKERRFGIKAIDRMRHMYVIGKTGMGKSTLLENMAAQDIQNGNGMAFIDPHGSAVETLLRYIPKERVDDVIYFAPFDVDYPVSFNILEDVGYDKRHLVVSGLMGAFKKIWKDQWSSRMEYILSNTLMALIEYPESTLLDVNTMLIDKVFRKKVISHITDPIVKSFWVDEFANFSDRYTQEATPAIQNKIGQFVSNPIIRNIVGQPHASFSFREAMDNKKIVIMNLSKGRMGEQNADLIGSMLVVKIYLDAMSRADLPPDELEKANPFYFYVDEFQSFANDTFANILSEARKYNLSLTVAHQYIEQMPEEVRSAVFGNIGTMILFRVGAIDADVLEKELSPTFLAENIVNLGFAQIYLKLMIDGLTSSPFSATTLPPLDLPEVSYVEQVIASSRKQYARPREEVEKFIVEHKETGQAPVKADGGKDDKKDDRPKKSYQGGDRPPRREGGYQQQDARPRSDAPPRREPPRESPSRREPPREASPQRVERDSYTKPERQPAQAERRPTARPTTPPRDTAPVVRREETSRTFDREPQRDTSTQDRQQPPRVEKSDRPQYQDHPPRREERKLAPEKQTTHQPFKEALAEASRPAPAEQPTRPMSLKELRPNQKTNPATNSANMGALRDVLAQALKEDSADKKKDEVGKSAPAPRPQSKPRPEPIPRPVAPTERNNNQTQQTSMGRPTPKEEPTVRREQPQRNTIPRTGASKPEQSPRKQNTHGRPIGPQPHHVPEIPEKVLRNVLKGRDNRKKT